MNDNDQIVSNLKLIKQRVNEGAKGVRDQRDAALELIGEDEPAAAMLRSTVHQYNKGCHETKMGIDRVIDLYIPQPVVKLPIELSMPRLKIDDRHVEVCTCLIPPLLFSLKMQYEDFVAFLNWFCGNMFGNEIRCFFQGGWDPYTFENISKPFNTRPNGKYDVYDYNEDHFGMVDWRIAMMRERNLTAVTTMDDACSLHKYNKGWWGWSWWNGANNVNGTAIVPAGYWHGWEEQHQDKPGYPELAAALTNYYHYLFKRYEGQFGKFQKWEYGNEVPAAQYWHAMHWQIANQYIPPDWPHPHFPKFRTQSSVYHEGWYKTKRLEETCMPSIHGCKDADSALARVAALGKPNVTYVLSQDGREPTPTPQGMADMSYAVLDAGHNPEFNLRPAYEYHDGWQLMGPNTDWSFQGMMKTAGAWFEQVRAGWFRFLASRGMQPPKVF